MKRSTQIGIRVSPEVSELAKQAATIDSRSVSAMVERLLIAHLVSLELLTSDAAKKAASRTGARAI